MAFISCHSSHTFPPISHLSIFPSQLHVAPVQYTVMPGPSKWQMLDNYYDMKWTNNCQHDGNKDIPKIITSIHLLHFNKIQIIFGLNVFLLLTSLLKTTYADVHKKERSFSVLCILCACYCAIDWATVPAVSNKVCKINTQIRVSIEDQYNNNNITICPHLPAWRYLDPQWLHAGIWLSSFIQ